MSRKSWSSMVRFPFAAHPYFFLLGCPLLLLVQFLFLLVEFNLNLSVYLKVGVTPSLGGIFSIQVLNLGLYPHHPPA